MEAFFALLVLCAGNSPVTSEFPSQRPVTRSFDVFFDLLLNKWLSKQSWGWWFETPSCSLWRHSNVTLTYFNLTSVKPSWTNFYVVVYKRFQALKNAFKEYASRMMSNPVGVLMGVPDFFLFLQCWDRVALSNTYHKFIKFVAKDFIGCFVVGMMKCVCEMAWYFCLWRLFEYFTTNTSTQLIIWRQWCLMVNIYFL